MHTNFPSISIIIPVWQEIEGIKNTLHALDRAVADSVCEMIFVDGDQNGSTLAAIRACMDSDEIGSLSALPIQCLLSSKGRSNQMNYGASKATSPILLFLHADTKLPSQGLEEAVSVLNSSPHLAAGAFDLAIDSPRWILKVIGKISSWRSRITRIPYGDQGIFIRRDVFEALGGFENVPIMEDVMLMRALKRRGLKIRFLPNSVLTSSRRWEKEGIIRCTLRNWCLITLYWLGIKPRILARFYQ
ncbi:MAG: TIGR04283 family arsenosugar biosynthesis glycosyltransferase [Cyanobacteria bacterium P01_D01_bin.73]